MSRRMKRLLAVRHAARVEAGAAVAEALSAVASQRAVAHRIGAAIETVQPGEGAWAGQGLQARLEWSARLGAAADAANGRIAAAEAVLPGAQARRVAAAKAFDRAEARGRELAGAEERRRDAQGRAK